MKKTKISQIKLNDGQFDGLPKNPRFIKNKKFKELVQSINDYPEMLELRPIVVNEDMVVLWGNMRLKAAKEAGLLEVPVTIAKGLTLSQQKEFIIKDNVSFGEWDFDELFSGDWEKDLLGKWGMEELIKDDEDLDANEIEGKYNNDNAVYPLIPIYDEKYNAVIIVCETRTEFANVKSKLGIIGKRQSYKKKFLGETSIITAKELEENEENNSKPQEG